MKKFDVQFVVSGPGPFPFDMLRYDACHPKHEPEAREMGSDADQTVMLISRNRDKSWQPTIGRWASFRWKVQERTIERKPVQS